MSAKQIYNPKTAFGNLTLLKIITEEQREFERKTNIGKCEFCDKYGRTEVECDQCDGRGVIKVNCDH